MNALTERLTGTQAARLTAYLPVQITGNLTGAGRQAGVFGREEFRAHIATAESVDITTADRHARAVLHTLRRSLPTENDARDALASLPHELSDLLA